MGSSMKKYLAMATVVAVAGVAAGAVRAEGEKVGDTQMCIQSSRIDQTPAIDKKTILVKMKGNGGYKRIDLVNSCSSLMFGHGFIYESSVDKLCTSDALRINQPAGGTCVIKQIVTIDEAEAKRLQSKDKGKADADKG